MIQRQNIGYCNIICAKILRINPDINFSYNTFYSNCSFYKVILFFVFPVRKSLCSKRDLEYHVIIRYNRLKPNMMRSYILYMNYHIYFCLSVHRLSIRPSVYPFVCLSFYLSIYLSDLYQLVSPVHENYRLCCPRIINFIF